MIESSSASIIPSCTTFFYTKAPAKLNLRLKITARREDGYHELSMLNVSIDLYDEIRIEFVDGGAPCLIIDPASLVQGNLLGPVEDNLVLHAARAFLREFELPASPRISLTKRIPVGSGLGGGSSDAAAVLQILSSAYALNYPQRSPVEAEKLFSIALNLGADVPFFLNPVPSLVRGIGEKLCPLAFASLLKTQCLLLLPPVRLSTSEMYAAFRERYPVLKERADEQAAFFSAAPPLHPRTLAELVDNDFQEIACRKSPLLNALFKELQNFDSDAAASITGSGSAVFILPRAGDLIPPRVLEELSECLARLEIPWQEVHMQSTPSAVSGPLLQASYCFSQ